MIERRMKRQRSQDDPNGDSHGSEEEGNEDRMSKRTRIDVDMQDDHDPLDLVGPTSSQVRPAVRFANDVNPAGDETPTRKSTASFDLNKLPTLTPILEQVAEGDQTDQDLDVDSLQAASSCRVASVIVLNILWGN